MTTTYDPFHPAYLDEADLRQEMTRVYDLCHGCRLCFKFCTSFPSLFEMIDEFEDQDAARLTPEQQDRVVDECFGCKLCYVNCPYIPGQSEWELDFPRLMLRADQVRAAQGRATIEDQALGRTDLAGRLGSGATAPLVNRIMARPGSVGRRVVEKVAGIAAERVLPPYARQRFSTWWRKRRTDADRTTPERGTVTLFPTCLVEYQDPAVGQAMVGVYERNGIGCDLPDGEVCCGAPWLHQGHLDRFRALATRNTEILAAAVREAQDRGEDPVVVVPQPTCGYVLKADYPDYLGTDDARLVADHTRDACEHLMAVHRQGGGLDTDFEGPVPESVTYHAPCHLRAQNVGLKSRDLLKLTGARVGVVAECSGIDGTWGYRAENYEISRKVAGKLATAIDRADAEVVAGDCHLANGGIVQETGRTPRHPLQVLATAYGIDEEDR